MPSVATQTDDMSNVLSKLVYELTEQDDTIISLKSKLACMTRRSKSANNDLDIIKSAIKTLCDNDIDFRSSLY